MHTASTTSPRSLPGRAVMAAVVAGTIAWVGVIAIGLQLAARTPSSLGFDLELLIEAGREVAAGRSPYAPDLVSGGPPMATSLFYSYPPPVAQAFSLLAAIPEPVIFGLWSIGAIVGLLVATELLRRRLAAHRSPREVLFVVAAFAPLTLPFAVGLLFGNLDVWFPLLYGVMLLAAIAPGRATAVGGGAALALAIVKLHPASLGLWFLTRAFRDDRVEGRSSARLSVVTAAVVGAVICGTSIVVWGTTVWSEYADVVRAGAQASIVDPRNAGIAAQVASLVGAGALAVTVWAAWRRPDPVESFAWAAAASLATLPVTWYHYPSAMLPIAVAAMLRASGPNTGRVSLLVAAGAVVAAVSIVWLPLLWVAIGLIVAAARASAPAPARVPAGVPAPATG